MLSKSLAVIAAIIALVGLRTLPAAAQEQDIFPANTITVVGVGSASGTPDVANMVIGVRTIDPNVASAFTINNQTVQTVIESVVNAGVAREDVSTFSIYAFVNNNPGGFADPANPPPPTYEVTNDLQIIVRDTSIVGNVIAAAVSAGANNISGLNFSFSNQDQLESQARTQAIADARAQAEEYAALANVQLGEILVIDETPTGFGAVPFPFGGGGGGGGGFGAPPVEAGQLSVNVQVEVTYAIVR